MIALGAIGTNFALVCQFFNGFPSEASKLHRLGACQERGWFEHVSKNRLPKSAWRYGPDTQGP